MTEVDIPALVAEIRKAGGLTQEQLAQRLGVTFGTINGWENGKHAPLRAFRRLLFQLAQELGVPTGDSESSATVRSAAPKRTSGGRR